VLAAVMVTGLAIHALSIAQISSSEASNFAQGQEQKGPGGAAALSLLRFQFVEPLRH
jgi:hypothetical protein